MVQQSSSQYAHCSAAHSPQPPITHSTQGYDGCITPFIIDRNVHVTMNVAVCLMTCLRRAVRSSEHPFAVWRFSIAFFIDFCCKYKLVYIINQIIWQNISSNKFTENQKDETPSPNSAPQ